MARIDFDLTGFDPLAPPRSFPVDPGDGPEVPEGALHGLAGEVVRAIEPYTEAHPMALLMDFLTTFGAVVGPGPHVRVGDDRHPPRLFTMIVGDTSRARKGTSRATIRQLFEDVAPGWAEKHLIGGLSSGEGLAQALCSEPELLVFEPEFSRTLTVGARTGNTVSEFLRQLWDGPSAAVMNRQPIKVDQAHLSVIGHITEDELRACMSRRDVDNGFANRFLWTWSRRTKLIPAVRPLPASTREPLIEAVQRAAAHARTTVEVGRASDAADVWEETYLQVTQSPLKGLAEKATSRPEAQLVRLSLLFALLDQSFLSGVRGCRSLRRGAW